MAPMHVKHAREVPEYEIDPKEFDFTNSVNLTKVLNTFSSTLLFLFFPNIWLVLLFYC